MIPLSPSLIITISKYLNILNHSERQVHEGVIKKFVDKYTTETSSHHLKVLMFHLRY